MDKLKMETPDLTQSNKKKTCRSVPRLRDRGPGRGRQAEKGGQL